MNIKARHVSIWKQYSAKSSLDVQINMSAINYAIDVPLVFVCYILY